MRAICRLIAAAAVTLACSGPLAGAAEDPADIFEFDAFGTLGLVHSSEDQADFTRSILVPYGAGATDTLSPKVDSVLAGQLTAHFTPRLSAVVQVVSEYRYDDSWTPRLEWANLKYELTPDLAVGVGRIASPIFMLTDTRRLSYALPWIRPPIEVYELYPVTSNDGVNALWTSRIGDTTHVFEVSYGRSDSKYSRNGQSGVAEARQQLILRSTLERGALSVHLGFSPAELTLPEYQPLFDAFRQFGPQGDAIADRYQPLSRDTRYLGIGATYDPGRWFVMGEWAEVKFDGVLSSRSGGYLSAGVRRGQFTPYVIWAETGPTRQRALQVLDLETLPPESRAAAAALNAQLAFVVADVPEQETFSLGTRWDFATSLCLKLQYDHTNLAAGNRGTLANFQPGFVPGGKVNLLGLSVSFVW